MPYMTITITEHRSGTVLWRRDFPYRGTIGDIGRQAAAAARRVYSRRAEIGDLFDHLTRTERTGPYQWELHHATLDTGPVAVITVKFNGDPAPARTGGLDITVTAEIAPHKPDPTAKAQFANADRAAQYAQMLANSGDYATGAVWLTDHNGIRHHIAPKAATR
ncbi:Uncharacterised protein [Mycobacteroides abscessus subsp. abscessus]|nr:Uncharacterised protein [Mycobacteroides abscessus subsp. abscessus]